MVVCLSPGGEKGEMARSLYFVDFQNIRYLPHNVLTEAFPETRGRVCSSRTKFKEFRELGVKEA